MDGEAGCWTTSGNIRLPPLARVMGVGSQQLVVMFVFNSVLFVIWEKLRNKEGWWDQVPLDRCLIETNAPYQRGVREDRIYSLFFGVGRIL